MSSWILGMIHTVVSKCIGFLTLLLHQRTSSWGRHVCWKAEPTPGNEDVNDEAGNVWSKWQIGTQLQCWDGKNEPQSPSWPAVFVFVFVKYIVFIFVFVKYFVFIFVFVKYLVFVFVEVKIQTLIPFLTNWRTCWGPRGARLSHTDWVSLVFVFCIFILCIFISCILYSHMDCVFLVVVVVVEKKGNCNVVKDRISHSGSVLHQQINTRKR